jgi:hypothetical protein
MFNSRVTTDDKVKEVENPVEDLRRYKANLSEVARFVYLCLSLIKNIIHSTKWTLYIEAYSLFFVVD